MKLMKTYCLQKSQYIKLKALRGGMTVLESTNYSYDAKISVHIVHGCRIMIKILLQVQNDLAIIKIIIRHLSAELAMRVR